MDTSIRLEPPDYAQAVAAALHLPQSKVQAALHLLADGNTIPFIARYRKEFTGELDENELRAIAAQLAQRQALFARKTDVLRLLHEQGVLSAPAGAHLVAEIGQAQSLAEVDDLYRPFRPKRTTRSAVARERGLAPLGAFLWTAVRERMGSHALLARAAAFVAPDRGVGDANAALQGAADIVAQEVADDASTRKWIRALTARKGKLCSVAVVPLADTVYAPYYAYEEAIARVVPHRMLAINRGEREGHLRVFVRSPQEEIEKRLLAERGIKAKDREHTPDPSGEITPALTATDWLRAAIVDGYRRLIAPAIERELRADLSAKAHEQAIHVFGANLRQLLLQPPLPGKVVLGVDPGFRTGCKLAVVDDTGRLLAVSVIYPTPPHNQTQAAQQEVLRLFAAHQISVVAIGNGTASRETEAFIVACAKQYESETGVTVPYVIVSEAGASVYSASVLAGEEFAKLDVSERSAVSIARRLQDPLAELVKIDPKSVGVGQYQHDVPEKRLDEQLQAVVESVVNQVGVDVNTASPSLLSYVSGLSQATAKNIVAYRETHGRFRTRQALAQVPRLGPKTLEQAAGFLRITGGDELLDATAIHPESYAIVRRLLSLTQASDSVLVQAEHRLSWLQEVRAKDEANLCTALQVGAPTLRDILQALLRPGRDPREEAPAPVLRTDILRLEDLTVGMELTGTVRSVVDFGAFVDVGLKHDGLIHISQLSDRFVRHPLDAVAVGDVVQVRVTTIDANRQRLGLALCSVRQEV